MIDKTFYTMVYILF